ncbi:MAG: response regulator [Chloroflexota bacterium]|nr:response regulator [Chloroflexota bacterium]
MDPDGAFRVLLIDEDADVASVVVAILTDEGYAVSVLVDTSRESILAAVGKQEPDCVLLDGSTATEYGTSWADAAYLAARERSIPTVMFSAHASDVREAQEGRTDRAREADFAAVVAKPFSLDDLLSAVAAACGKSEVFDPSPAGDRERTLALARRLRELGATDIRTSDRREWATFRPPNVDAIRQLYWWQLMGVYLVGSYEQKGGLKPIGQFFELEAPIAASLPNANQGD